MLELFSMLSISVAECGMMKVGEGITALPQNILSVTFRVHDNVLQTILKTLDSAWGSFRVC